MEDGDPEKTAELFARTRPGFLETHPNSFLEWEEIADDPRRPFANVKYFSSTFDAIHPGTMDRLLKASERRAPLFFQIYGQSECGPLVGAATRAGTPTRPTAAAWATPCRASPSSGWWGVGQAPVEGQPWYIDVYTPGRAVTYYGEKERFEKQAIGTWWRGMDIGYRSKWGCLHLLDREVDHIPGVHSTLEVEDAVLAKLPELTELVLVPGPGQEPVPVVSTRKDVPLDPERWRAAAATTRSSPPRCSCR